MAGRLVVIGGWGVPVEMLSELYEFWPGSVELVSLDDALVSQCDSVADVADELLSRYTEPSVWLGWSLGAQVVMEAACRNTEAVSGVITLAGFPKFLAGEGWPYGMSGGQFEAFSRGLNNQSERYWQRFLMLMINGVSDARAERQRLKIWLDKGPGVSPDNLTKSLEWLRQADQRSLWSCLSIPALHVTGDRDQVVSSWVGGLAFQPSTNEVSIPGMAHWPGGLFSANCRMAIETFLQLANKVHLASKADIARGFGNARATYEGASRLQRLMGNAMFETLQSQVGQSALLGRVLDLGCGTGWFTRKLAGLGCAVSVTGMDLSPGMVEHAGENSSPDITWVVADAEAIPLPDDSCDLIFSNLMIQWCADPANVLRECQRVLRPGGRLLVSTLLEGTLRELDQAWRQADPGQNHINRFEPEAAFRETVTRELPGAKIETQALQLPYASPLTLAAELKQLGAGYKDAGRRRTVTAPSRLRAMCRHYPKPEIGTTEAEGGVVATYEAAWAYWRCGELSNQMQTKQKRVQTCSYG